MSPPAAKQSIEDLAVFGGPPLFERKLHVGRPNIGDRHSLLSRINAMLDERWLTNDGPYVREFERQVADLAGVEHCVPTTNATLALQIAVRALGLTGEVIIPSLTFIATAHSLRWEGLTPVFCDARPDTWNLDPSKVEELVGPKTSGILAVHLWGRPCDVDALQKVAERHRLRLLFDASHAVACSYRGRKIGSFGDAEIFSFHATKFVNSFEGGAIVTASADLASKARLMRNFGFAGYDQVVSLGINAKMSEVSAAMGLTSLESMAKFVEVNERNYRLYRRALEGLDGVSLLEYDESEACNYQYLVLVVEKSFAHIGRDLLLEILWSENVLARRYFYPGCHRMEPYRSEGAKADLPVTEWAVERVLTLPTGTDVGPEEIQSIGALLKFILAHGEEIGLRLREKLASVEK